MLMPTSPRFDGVLVRFGEIGIKSAPVRRAMAERLRRNLESALLRAKVEGAAQRMGARLWLVGPAPQRLLDVATHTFGVVSASPCRVVKADLETLCREAPTIALAKPWTSFAIRARREGTHTFSSQDVAVQVGSAVYKAAEADGRKVRVDLERPDYALDIDVRQDRAYLFDETGAGPGGIPMGSQGRVVALLSDEASFVAAWLMMRRGCDVVPLHAGTTGSLPTDAVEALVEWGMPDEVELLPVCTGRVAKSVLLQAASQIARDVGAIALVTGETLSSRLAPALEVPVLRPVCGLDPGEYARWRDRAKVPAIVPESILDDGARETVESMTSLWRTVGL